ncbi:DUF1552 domain-containing protein [Sorangium sp. So ce362]|uniref:DUF1552 domain-containing protein n=1 Tax=Sorangium sp. So ce362 TaxID=3133303 RepID=UPI003F646825
MSKKLNRRIFLRGMGGAVLAAPFLSSVWERTARGDTPAPGKSLIVMFTHYGCITNSWFPAKTQGELTADDLTPTSLAPLAPHAKKLLMPRGIRSMNEWTVNRSRGQGNDPHTQTVGSFFTCQPITPNSNDPFSFDGATKFNAKPVGPSLDHVMAQQLSPQGAPLLLNMAGQNQHPQSAISYSAAEIMYSGLDASQAFSSLTGLFHTGMPMNPDTYAAIRGKSVLDLVKDDLQTLQRFDMSKADKQKLEAWKELLSSTGDVMVPALCNAELAERLGATAANASSVEAHVPGSDALTTKVSGDLDGADIYSAIAALAAACNVNPLIFLKYPAKLRLRRARHPYGVALPLSPPRQCRHAGRLLRRAAPRK